MKKGKQIDDNVRKGMKDQKQKQVNSNQTIRKNGRVRK